MVNKSVSNKAKNERNIAFKQIRIQFGIQKIYGHFQKEVNKKSGSMANNAAANQAKNAENIDFK